MALINNTVESDTLVTPW